MFLIFRIHGERKKDLVPIEHPVILWGMARTVEDAKKHAEERLAANGYGYDTLITENYIEYACGKNKGLRNNFLYIQEVTFQDTDAPDMESGVN